MAAAKALGVVLARLDAFTATSKVMAKARGGSSGGGFGGGGE